MQNGKECRFSRNAGFCSPQGSSKGRVVRARICLCHRAGIWCIWDSKLIQNVDSAMGEPTRQRCWLIAQRSFLVQ